MVRPVRVLLCQKSKINVYSTLLYKYVQNHKHKYVKNLPNTTENPPKHKEENTHTDNAPK